MWASIFVSAGRMVAGEKKSVSNTQYKRPYGCAVISVADLLTADFKDDHLLKIYSWVFKISPKLPGKSQYIDDIQIYQTACNLLKYIANLWHIIFYRCNAESEWYQIHDSIIRKVSSRYSHIGSNTGKI